MSSRPIGSKTGGLGAIPKIKTVSYDVSHHKKTLHIKIPTDFRELGLGHFGCLRVNLQPAAPAGLSSTGAGIPAPDSNIPTGRSHHGL